MRRDARAGVGDGDDGVAARLRLNVQTRVVLVEIEVFDLDAELAAVGHGVAGVDAEVHQHLMNLRRVAENRPHIIGRLVADFDGLRQRLAQNLDDLFNEVARLQGDVLAGDAARE